MAMKPCHECAAEISTEAKACPACGAPRRMDGIQAVLTIAYALAAFVVIDNLERIGPFFTSLVQLLEGTAGILEAFARHLG